MSRFFKKFFSRFGIRKVNVPNLSGLSRSQAKATLSAVGLTWTETENTTTNSSLDQSLVSQGITHNTAVIIGSSVPITYYQYVAPPNFNPGFGPNFPPDFNPGFQPSNPGFGEPPPNPGFEPPPNPGFEAPPNPGFEPPPPAFTDLLGENWTPAFKSVGVSTLIRTPDGLVKAEDLQVGDVLLSSDIEGFPYTYEEGVTEAAINWSETNPVINLTTTTIVSINRVNSSYAVVINGDVFSQYHWILIKRDGQAKFVMSENIIKETDEVYAFDAGSWESIQMYEIVPVEHETVSINCEPFDMFWTERMLTHDSVAI